MPSEDVLDFKMLLLLKFTLISFIVNVNWNLIHLDVCVLF